MKRAVWLALLFSLCVVSLAGCMGNSLPAGYESLRSEVSLVEGSKYILALRDQYIVARQRGQLTQQQFALAVKADQVLTVAWNELVAAMKAKQDSAALWAQVVMATARLEQLLMLWIPQYQPVPNKPAVLGS